MFPHKSTWAVLFLCVALGQCATRINYPGCDRAGWKCIKVQASPIRYDIEYVCQNTGGIIFALWNFNAPAEIKSLRVVNCSSVEIDLTCTAVGRQVEGLHIKNVGVLNFTNLLYRDTAQMPEKVLLEDIKLMPLIPEKTFKQMKHPLASAHRCAVNTKPTDIIEFRNVHIGTVQQNAFFNLTEIKQFTWNNVTVDVMEPLAVQTNMDKEQSFDIVNSTFKKLDYKAFDIRSPQVVFKQSKFDELPRSVIDSTSFKFDFINNTVQKVHSFAFILLSQDITFELNNFNSLQTSALQGIGPGLLENAFMSFGQLKFTYNFNNNTISHSDIGGLNPDWIAYKNVHSYIYVTWNKLTCSCKELGWITLRAGLGDHFSTMMNFNSKYLDKTNNNFCLNSPCDLPVSVMVGMHIKFGLCGTHIPLVTWCKKYKPHQDDLGFGAMAKTVLNKWQNDFASPEPEEELSSFNDETLEDIFALAQKNEDKFIKYVHGNPKESYFKIEKTGLQEVTDTSTDHLAEVADPVENSTVSDIVFFNDDEVLNNNGTEYKYQLDVRNGIKNETSADPNFNILKKEFEDNQKEFVKKSHEEWQAQRKKRMVYFKVYGNLMTID